VSVVALCRPAHRSDDGIAPAARSRVGDPLPNRAVSAALELAQLLAVVGDVALKAGGDGGRACSGGLQRLSKDGADDDLAEAPIVAGEEARRFLWTSSAARCF
jgi:hypothetical protein